MLVLKNITFRVSDETAGEKTIIKDINLTIEDNQFVEITVNHRKSLKIIIYDHFR